LTRRTRFVFRNRQKVLPVGLARLIRSKRSASPAAEPSTGLVVAPLDRPAFAAAVERSLGHGQEVGVVVVELDDLDGLLESLGEATGALLAAMEARVARTIRPDDLLGRLDASRLAVLSRDSRDDEASESMAARLAARVSEPFFVGGETVTVTARVGYASADGGVVTADELLERAAGAAEPPQES
jgi:GGDEF domain-containing protein